MPRTVLFFSKTLLSKLIFNSDQRVFCCLTDGRVQVDEKQKEMHVRVRDGSELQNDLMEDNGLRKDTTQCKH